jgi:hypothetical protein
MNETQNGYRRIKVHCLYCDQFMYKDEPRCPSCKAEQQQWIPKIEPQVIPEKPISRDEVIINLLQEIREGISQINKSLKKKT